MSIIPYRLSVFKNGYIAILLGNNEGYIFEHIVVAEKILGRKLRKGEEVHHLDFNPSNNSPRNLLVLLGSQHAKLHKWLEKKGLDYKPTLAPTRLAKLAACKRCIVCNFPTTTKAEKFCNKDCSLYYGKKYAQNGNKKPSKKKLTRLLRKLSRVKIGKKYGVSDNAVKMWAIKYGISHIKKKTKHTY